MKKFTLTFLFLLAAHCAFSQLTSERQYYSDACNEIAAMLSGENNINFQHAVFITENAYFENQLNERAFDYLIESYTSFCRGIMLSGNIIYPEKDTERATAQCAVFTFITDSVPYQTPEGVKIHAPFAYNYDDFAGQKEWSSMFVSTLMQTKKGNCHSLPYLYKMIMDKLGYKSYLSLAPNHIYIKAQNNRTGWYNIELTCGDFPTDAWYVASGYIHTDAIRNGIYMDTLSAKQSVALCLVDLAQGYQAKFGTEDGSFILHCCETALKHFPNYINALLYKAETLAALYRANENSELLAQMNAVYTEIHRLGYRKMPPDMYLNWLKSSGTQTTNYRMKSLLEKKE